MDNRENVEGSRERQELHDPKRCRVGGACMNMKLRPKHSGILHHVGNSVDLACVLRFVRDGDQSPVRLSAVYRLFNITLLTAELGLNLFIFVDSEVLAQTTFKSAKHKWDRNGSESDRAPSTSCPRYNLTHFYLSTKHRHTFETRNISRQCRTR